MASLNKVLLIGNLTRDPELRYTANGTAVADLRLAVNRSYTVNGERREDTLYITVVAWARQAEAIQQYLRKGAPLLVEGYLRSREWDQNGVRHTAVEVVAERTQFLPRQPNGQPAPAPAAAPAAAAAPATIAGPDDAEVPF